MTKKIEKIPLESIAYWKKICLNDKRKHRSFEPLTGIKEANSEARIAGEIALKAGRAGCLIIAGGLGTRLGYQGPKGTYPLDAKGNTLFKLHCKKVLECCKKYGRTFPIAIMTSDANDLATRQYFDLQDYFGLGKENVCFFKQRSLPYLNQEGNLFLDAEDHLAVGPNGNGELLQLFAASSFYHKWKKRGIDVLTIIPVDNLLAEPFDAELIGYHLSHQDEITINVIEKVDPLEKVGVLVKEAGKVHIVEYSEIGDHESAALDEDGKLKYRLANINLFAFSMAFVEKCATVEMPLHAAWKKSPYLDESGKICVPKEPNAWKLETFIFDLLPLAERVGVIISEREKCFAPLKNREGADSLESLKKAGILKE